MIFTSQSGLTDYTRGGEWDGWYLEHLTTMVTVPGIGSAQRFKTDHPDHPPSLAMYTIASESVFRDPYYLSIRGMGEWLPMIERRFYRRNLFRGLDTAPGVADDSRLIVVDTSAPDVVIPGLTLSWLEAVGLDGTTPWRGIAVVNAGVAADVPAHVGAVYQPATRCMVSM
jgi:hypothetical protein